MRVLMFQSQFVEAIEHGTKTTTLLPRRSRPIRVGDTLSLRTWSRKASRCRHIILGAATCTAVDRVDLIFDSKSGTPVICFAGHRRSKEIADFIAQKDGFESFDALVRFYRHVHGYFPFEGNLITWQRIK